MPSRRRGWLGMKWRRRGEMLGITTVLVSIALLAQSSVVSQASWNDREWDNGAVGTVSCGPAASAFSSRGAGRVLSGSLFGTNLDAVVAADGVRVTNNGQRALHTPSGAVQVPVPTVDAWVDPLSVTALSAVNVNLGNGILKLPLNNSTGVLGQYGQAQSNGQSAGAAGYITSTGGIGLSPSGGYPELATLSLSQLVGSISPSVAGTLGNVTDVSLRMGAVTGRATLDGCASAWANSAATGLLREYLVTSLRTDITSPTVGSLVTSVNGVVQTLKNTVTGLPTNATVLASLKSGTEGLVNGVLGAASGLGVTLGNVTIRSLTVNPVNTTALDTLLTQGFSDPGGVLTVNPSSGSVSVNTAALLAAAYPGVYGSGLNALPPNTNLLSDPTVISALSAALTAAINAWIAQVNAALTTAINSISLSVGIDITLQLQVCTIGCLNVPLVKIVTTTAGTLTALTTTTSLEVLGVGLLTPVLNTLVGNVVSALVSGLSGVVQTAVNTQLNPLRTLSAALSNLSTLTGALATAVSTAYSAIYGPGIVAITLNAQNDPTAGNPEPVDLGTLPNGRYDVAAVRVGVLEAVAGGGRLYFGRGSVGQNCAPAERAVGACAGY